MSNRLYVMFKPGSPQLTDNDMATAINARFPNTAKVDDDSISFDGDWPGYLTIANNYYIDAEFPYWNFFFWSYWDDIFNGCRFRHYVMELCEALGASEWWYIEENSIDLYEELDITAYEKILAEAVDIEDFNTPRYFPASEHHLFKDSARRVKALRNQETE